MNTQQIIEGTFSLKTTTCSTCRVSDCVNKAFAQYWQFHCDLEHVLRCLPQSCNRVLREIFFEVISSIWAIDLASSMLVRV